MAILQLFSCNHCRHWSEQWGVYKTFCGEHKLESVKMSEQGIRLVHVCNMSPKKRLQRELTSAGFGLKSFYIFEQGIHVYSMGTKRRLQSGLTPALVGEQSV